METRVLLHSTTIAFGEKAAVLMGPSGSGKSTLALRMISLGAILVSDDQTRFSVESQKIVAHSIPTIEGQIEVRGVGILRTPFRKSAEVAAFVDMSKIERSRLPPKRDFELLGQKATLYHKLIGDHFADALMQILKYGSKN